MPRRKCHGFWILLQRPIVAFPMLALVTPYILEKCLDFLIEPGTSRRTESMASK